MKISAQFSNLPKLNTLILPDCVKSIEKNAFQSSTSLKNVKLPKNLEYIGWGAFSGCTQLTEITIPKTAVESAENKLIVTFSNFIDDAAVTSDSLIVTQNGKTVSCGIKPIKSDDNNTAYSKEFKITGENLSFEEFLAA